jgi:hypothetical protein
MVTGGRSLPWREVEKTCVRSGQVRGVGRDIFVTHLHKQFTA